MTIDQIKAECRKAIELAEKATAPDTLTINRYDHGGCRVFVEGDAQGHGRDLVADFYDENNREAYIHARTFTPAAARGLLICIEYHEYWRDQAAPGTVAHEYNRKQLAAICAQFSGTE